VCICFTEHSHSRKHTQTNTSVKTLLFYKEFVLDKPNKWMTMALKVHLRVCVCVYVCVPMCVSVRACVCAHVKIHIRYVYVVFDWMKYVTRVLSVCACVCVLSCVCARTYVSPYTCVCVYVCTWRTFHWFVYCDWKLSVYCQSNSSIIELVIWDAGMTTVEITLNALKVYMCAHAESTRVTYFIQSNTTYT